MTKTKLDKHSENLPLAIALSTDQMKGWLSKHLPVPPGRQGIALFRNGKFNLFPSGENRVLTDLDRLKGDGAGFYAGYLPLNPFNAMLTIMNLVSADKVLLDLSLLCSINVIDPLRFFTEQVIPHKIIESGTFMLDDLDLFKFFSNLVSNYIAQDLVDGLIDADLIEKAYQVINPLIANAGLALIRIDLVTCWRKEDRLVIEEQVLALEQKMADLAFEKKLAEIENQKELDLFLKENAAEVAGKTRLVKPGKEQKDQNLAGKLKAWITSINADNKPGQNFRLRTLAAQKALIKDKETHRKITKPNWWVPKIIWIIVILLLAFSITYFLKQEAQTHQWASRSELYVSIWAFAIIALLQTAAALFKGWEKALHEKVDWHNAMGFDLYEFEERNSLNLIVRDQCKMELDLQKTILNELRGRVYQEGNSELALEMRRLELKLEDFINKIQSQQVGTPIYLKEGVKISHQSWHEYLENEELLLIQAALLSDEAHKLQVKFNQSEFELNSLKSYEVNVDAFYKAFSTRERVLQSPQFVQSLN